jgi:hypothetical protein
MEIAWKNNKYLKYIKIELIFFSFLEGKIRDVGTPIGVEVKGKELCKFTLINVNFDKM